MSRLSLLIPLLALACGGDASTADTSDGDTDEPPTNPNHEIPNSDQGNLVLFITPPSALDNNARVSLGGIFAESRRGYANLVQCVAFPSTLCVRELPTEPDTWVQAERLTNNLRDAIRPRDVGPEVWLGPYEAPRVEVDGLSVYYGMQASMTPPPGQTLDLSFGPGEWGSLQASDAIEIAGPVDLISPNPMQPQLFTNDLPVELRWTPGGVGDVYLSVVTAQDRRFYLLEDDGEFDLDLTDFELNNMEVVDIALSRWTTGMVDADGHEILVGVQYDQWLTGSFRELEGRIPIPTPPDNCEQAMAADPIEPGSYWGVLDYNTNAFNPGSSGCTGWNANGLDAVFAYDMEPYEVLDVKHRLPNGDAALYLLTDCHNTGSCLVGADQTYSGGVEQVAYYNDSDDPLRVYIVADAFSSSGGGLFELDVTSQIVVQDVLVDSCVEAMNKGPVAPGYFMGDLSHFSNVLNPELAEECEEAPGGEGLMQVLLQPDETLYAQATMTGGTPILYVMYSCSVLESCTSWSGASGSTAYVEYHNESEATEFVYLVLDSTLNSGPYELEVQVH